jgi:hypothetical protein
MWGVGNGVCGGLQTRVGGGGGFQEVGGVRTGGGEYVCCM